MKENEVRQERESRLAEDKTVKLQAGSQAIRWLVCRLF